ncbi:MAG TPA: hypothetical protein VHD56_09195 [Tepidisphaeraceae bacterium]|nr:hypothetical protein [Tepidisphaeraceae bacterium]
MILKYQVNVIWNDEWVLADPLIKLHQHTLQLSDFWVMHHDHRLPIPLAIMSVLAVLTYWNTQVECFFGYAMVCMASLLLAVLLRSPAANDSPSSSWKWKWFAVNVLLFSPVQCENWLFGFGACQNFLPLPLLVAALVLIDRKGLNWRTVLLSAALIESASLSLANGLLGWPLLFAFIALSNKTRDPRQKRQFLGIWLLAAILSIALHLWHHQSEPITAQFHAAGIIERVQYFLVFLGTALFYGLSDPIPLATCMGIVLIGWFIWLLIRFIQRWFHGSRESIEPALPWLVLGGYAVGSAILGALGRAGLGVEQAGTSRYTTISICLLICLIGIPTFHRHVSNRLSQPSAILNFQHVITSLLVAALIWAGVRSIGVCAQSQRHYRIVLAHLSFIELVMEPSTERLISYRTDLLKIADTLDQLGYLHPPLIKNGDVRLLQPSGSIANSESNGIVEAVWQSPDGQMHARGWSILPALHRAADSVLVSYDTPDGKQQICAIADVVQSRPDLAKTGGEYLQQAGWSAAFPSNRLPAQSTPLKFWAYDAEHQQAFPLAKAAEPQLPR